MATFLDEAGRQARLTAFARLVRNDLREKMFGSLLGVVWVFLSPAFYVLILWLVFQFGFKVVPVEGVPFVVWFVAGFWPWLFLSEAIATGTGAILEKSFLIRKVRFDVEWIPLVKLASAFFVHMLLGILVAIIVLSSALPLSLSSVFLIYYAFAAMVLVYGIVLLTSSLILFLKDMQKLVEIGLQMGFWATPIFWQLSLVPEGYQWLFKLNPFFYIVEGYRASLVAPQIAHPGWLWAAYFWGIVAVLVLVGRYVFRRLRPQFADVL